MCLPIAAFAFVGLEITAATVVEARAGTTRQSIPITPLKRPATLLPLVVGPIYCLVALLVALNVDSTSPDLPAQGWLPKQFQSTSHTDSVIVQSALAAGIPKLPSVVTGFIVFTALTAANTALYVASRTLFGLTRERRSWWEYFGITTQNGQVPLRALFASSIFWFVGYFSLFGTQSAPGSLTDSVSNLPCIYQIELFYRS
jgi:amino acid transporter